MEEPRKFRRHLIQDAAAHNKNGLTKVSHNGVKKIPHIKPGEEKTKSTPVAEVKQPESPKYKPRPRKLIGKY